MIFALGATLVSGIIFIIALNKESTILTSSAAHCSTFAGKWPVYLKRGKHQQQIECYTLLILDIYFLFKTI